MKKIHIFCLVLCIACVKSPAQTNVNFQPEDQRIFDRFLQYADQKNLSDQPVSSSIINIAKFFTNTPYVGGTLEGDSVERLRVNLRELDCTTLVENVLALHLLLQSTDRSFDHFCQILQNIRYRDGKMDGYLSRLHYTSEWLENNKTKIPFEILNLPGGQKFSPNVSYMSTHCSLYPALKAHPDWCVDIAQTEADVNRLSFSYLPKNLVNSATKEIQNGDLIAITTHIQGLDVAHMGFAVVQKGKVYLLHASSDAKKVIISTETLHGYLANRKNHSGIIVARIEK